MSKGCFSFNIVNQFQHAVVQAWAFYPDVRYGTEAGETLLICRFPSLKLHVGHYHLRAHVSEPPGMEFYQTLDGICPFEVVRTADTRPWGWVPAACVYHEEWTWTVEQFAVEVASQEGKERVSEAARPRTGSDNK
jgi:lipopolysaccharide transport system ATP-binding protein